MQPERRQSERSDIFLIVEFRPAGRKVEYSQGVTENISGGGFSFDSQNHNFDPGEFLEIKLKHPQRDISVSVSGEILWKRESWYKCVTGINYRDLDMETERSLNKLVSAAGSKDVELSIPQTEGTGSEKESPDVKPDSVQKSEPAGEKTENEIKAGPERKAANGICSAEGSSLVDSGINSSNSNSSGKAEPSAEIRKNRKTLYMIFAAVFLIVIAVVLSGRFGELKNVLVSNPSIPFEDVDENDLLLQNDDITSGSITQAETPGPVQADGMPANDNILPDGGEEQLPSVLVIEQEIVGGTLSGSVEQQKPAAEKEKSRSELPEEEKAQTVSGSSSSGRTGNEKLAVVENEDRFYRSAIKEESLPVTPFETKISFGRNSDVINPEFDQAIDKIAVLLINNPSAVAIVEGYTDNVGLAEYNIDLSIRRANAVRDLFVLRGVDASRMETAGLGDSNPVSSNETGIGRSRNRRVEIRIILSGD